VRRRFLTSPEPLSRVVHDIPFPLRALSFILAPFLPSLASSLLYPASATARSATTVFPVASGKHLTFSHGCQSILENYFARMPHYRLQ